MGAAAPPHPPAQSRRSAGAGVLPAGSPPAPLRNGHASGGWWRWCLCGRGVPLSCPLLRCARRRPGLGRCAVSSPSAPRPNAGAEGDFMCGGDVARSERRTGSGARLRPGGGGSGVRNRNGGSAGRSTGSGPDERRALPDGGRGGLLRRGELNEKEVGVGWEHEGGAGEET